MGGRIKISDPLLWHVITWEFTSHFFFLLLNDLKKILNNISKDRVSSWYLELDLSRWWDDIRLQKKSLFWKLEYSIHRFFILVWTIKLISNSRTITSLILDPVHAVPRNFHKYYPRSMVKRVHQYCWYISWLWLSIPSICLSTCNYIVPRNFSTRNPRI